MLRIRADADADFAYDIRNADGAEAMQCGNGARCLARYARDRGIAGDELRARAPCGVVAMRIERDGDICVDMGAPRLEPADIPFAAPRREARYALQVGARSVRIAAVSMGNPHAVLEVESVARADVAGLGGALETHTAFPERANVGFMEIVDPGRIRLRVWERGVGETPGCGTGACAAVAAGRIGGALDAAVTVGLPGGELRVQWDGEGRGVLLRGGAEYAYSGEIDL